MTGNTQEHKRLEEARTGSVPWKAWGPYVSERQWGTVREDYSQGGDAWNYFTHDQARSRAYRWGEDGIAGICDERQRICLALALWNGADPILKERMFGLSNGEGNHGEDVKEYWFYLDSTPTHSYLKCQYKYPQREFPYFDLVSTNQRRGKQDMEYELLDTGIFDDDRYFDVVVEYAKAAPDDILMLVTAHNRGPDPATVHLLPTLWFRNTWSWGDETPKPSLTAVDDGGGVVTARASHAELGDWLLRADASAQVLFCENETNNQRLVGAPNASPHVKDGINDYVVAGAADAVNPERTGTKVAAHHVLEIPPGDSASIRLRLTAVSADGTAGSSRARPLGAGFERVMGARRTEADRFYETVIPPALDAGGGLVTRQALAGLLWGKQYYEYDVHRWLGEHGINPWDPSSPRWMRNTEWFHMVSGDVISMPDKWEYPWFAAWDLAFHTRAAVAGRCRLCERAGRAAAEDRYMHPNGQIPAYEWNFSDVNPPVTAWAALYVYEREAEIRGEGDRQFLARVFNRLLSNFTWWVNRKDPDGRNLFQGGFLGLDNIGIFDRSAPLPGGGTLEQADGTAWMALYCQWMLQIAAELAKRRPGLRRHGFEVHRPFRVDRSRDEPAWRRHGALGRAGRLLLRRDADARRLDDPAEGPLARRAAAVVRGDRVRRRADRPLPGVVREPRRVRQRASPMLSPALAHRPGPNPEGRRISSLVDEPRLRRILSIMLDEDEFLGPHGIRAISRRHLEQPCRVRLGRPALRGSVPARGVRHGHVRRQLQLAGPGLVPDEPGDHARAASAAPLLRRPAEGRVPDGLGKRDEPAARSQPRSAGRLMTTFTRDENGRRPVFGGIEKFQTDPHWHDLLLFHEYFHGDNGAGIGASHQTGWTGTVALLPLFARRTARRRPRGVAN